MNEYQNITKIASKIVSKIASKIATKMASKAAFHGWLLSLLLFVGCAVSDAISRALPTPIDEVIIPIRNVNNFTLLGDVKVTYKPFALGHNDKFSLGDFDSPYLIQIEEFDFSTNGTIVLGGEDYPLVKTNYGGAAYLGISGFSFSNYLRFSTNEVNDEALLTIVFHATDGTITTSMELGKVSVSAPTDIYTWMDLQGMKHDLAARYVLRTNITFPDKGSKGLGAAGFEPVGDGEINSLTGVVTGDPFTGSFAGGGHRIANLSIDRDDRDKVGIWGVVDGADSVIKDFVLDHGGIAGDWNVGGVVGYLATGMVSNIGVVSSQRMSVAGAGSEIGGLVGYNDGGTVHGYVTADVSGASDVGGLVGYNDGGGVHGYVTADVSGTGYGNVGGLVGGNDGTVTGYATGAVSGTASVGGLVGGNNFGGRVTGYVRGNVLGTENVGGLVGVNDGATTTGYVRGDVSGTTNVGGLAGENNIGEVTGYVAGYVSGDNVGSLVGYNHFKGTANGYWEQGSSGQINSVGFNDDATFSGVGISAIADVVFTSTNTYWDNKGTPDDATDDVAVFTNATFLHHFALPGANATWPTLRAASFFLPLTP